MLFFFPQQYNNENENNCTESEVLAGCNFCAVFIEP